MRISNGAHMNYRRLLLLAEVEADDAQNAIAAIRRVAPNAEELTIVAHGQDGQRVEDIRRTAAAAARTVELKLVSALDANELSALGRESRTDLIVLGPAGVRLLAVAGEVRKQLGVPLLYAGSHTEAEAPIAKVACVATGERALRAVNAFAREASPDIHITFASAAALPRTGVDLV